jgi:AAA+ superfamily predicted ATPase
MSSIREEITSLIRARYPLVYIVSFEERRVEEELREIAKQLNKKLLVWTITGGFLDGASRPDDNTADPIVALDQVLKTAQSAAVLYVLKDFHPFLDANQSVPIRKLRDAISHLQNTNSSLFILSPVLRIPPELEKDITVVDYPVPSKAELRELLGSFEKDYARRASIHLDGATCEAMVGALLGLTRVEAENVLSRALISDGRLDASDLPMIIREKEQIIKKSGILEYQALEERLEDIGGLDQLKDWLRQTRSTFDEAAGKRGVQTPKGVLLLGVPGCGKSLTAKAVAHAWQMPLLRFDLGKVFGMYVGQSEENIRRAIRMAEAVAPCVLWIDELEKGFAGVGTSGLDSGVTARVYGAFITWLQEKKSPVFVVGTANDINSLPPELLRKGRFDEIFFVDLPSEQERIDIFRKRLNLRCLPEFESDKMNLPTLAATAKGFTGSDIEAVINEALKKAFADGKRDPKESDFLKAINETLPLSATMRDKIEELRKWARTRARPASRVTESVPVPSEEDFGNRRQLEF